MKVTVRGIISPELKKQVYSIIAEAAKEYLERGDKDVQKTS